MVKMYAVKNTLSDKNALGGVSLFDTDAWASVLLSDLISKSETLRLEECQIICIGNYDESTQEIKTEWEENGQTVKAPYIIAYDTRRIKEKKLEDRTPEQVKNDLSNMK